jgi:DNA-binding response OmpR family regulator
MGPKPSFPTVPIKEVPASVPENSSTTYRPVVLVVDDESAVADTLAEVFTRSGYAAMPTYDAEDALETALLMPPELLITDVFLPGKSGIELAVTVRGIFPDCKILLFSGQAAAADLLALANRKGHRFEVISKPLRPSELLGWASRSLKQRGSKPGGKSK